MNPEFKRNLWLEITPSRLVIMPSALGLIATLTLLTAQTDAPNRLFWVAFVMFALLAVSWGGLLAVSSIGSEINERTWDQQRLSSLTPWEIAWGKLFGSTAYAWYGGLLCLAIALFATRTLPGFASRCVWLAAATVAAVAFHAWLMAGRLHTLDTSISNAAHPSNRLLGTAITLPVLAVLYTQAGNFLEPAAGPGRWWDLDLPRDMQALAIAGVMLALGLLALWRSMTSQLMLRTVPWAWAVGVVVLGGVIAGFETNNELSAAPLVSLALTALAATYYALFTSKNHLLVWHAVVFHQKNSATRRLLEALPLWPVSLALALVCVFLFGLVGGAVDNSPTPMKSMLWMATLHCLRDCGIYHFFAFRHTLRKPAGITLLTLGILGVVLPGLLANLAPALAQWCEPLVSGTQQAPGTAAMGTLAWLAMGVHLVVVGGLVMWRWQSCKPASVRHTVG